MKRVLLVLLTAALIVPAYGEVFKATHDGSFTLYRGSQTWEGYSNRGLSGSAGLARKGYDMGWFSFSGAVEATSLQTLADFLTANSNVSATFYVCLSNLSLGTGTFRLESLRCGNSGNLVEDQGGGYTYNALPIGTPTSYTGASELAAWRGCQPQASATAFSQFSDGIYYSNDPASLAGTQGEPWITPTGRIANGGIGSINELKFGPGLPIRYDTGLDPWQPQGSNPNPATPATGLYHAFYFDTPAGGGRSIWALEDLLGWWTNRGSLHTEAMIANAGQILNAGTISLENNYVAPDAVVGAGEWLAIPIDDTFLRDMVNNPQNKGFICNQALNGLVASTASQTFITRDQSPGTYAPYMLITVNASTGCWGDIDDSGMVNGDDLAILAYAWLSTPTSANWYAPADLTGDGVVNGDDLAVVAYGWLQCIPK